MSIRFSIVATVLFLVGERAEAASPTPSPYAVIDSHALKASSEAEESIASLAKYLAEPCKTDKDKARAVYRWITDRIAYDIEGLLSGKELDTKSDSVLKSRKSTCDGYSNLYVDLAKEMGLEAVRVIGYAKGFDYKPGKPFVKPNHAWNAVKLEGRWDLLDSTWGAGSVEGKKFVKRFSEIFFLISSEKLIFTHFPSDAEWQLQKVSITLKQFEDMPKVQPTLFMLGVAPEAIHSDIDAEGFRELVFAYDIPGDSTSLINGPLDKFLTEGKEYTWVLRSNDFAKLIVMQGGKPVAMEKTGTEFRAKVKAQKGKLQIAAAEKSTDTRFSLVLEYMVE
jgi:Transglutaminase-like superfamily